MVKAWKGNPRTQEILHSPDGIAWSSLVLNDASIADIDFGNGVYVGTQDDYVWIGQTLGSLVKPRISQPIGGAYIAYADGKFVSLSSTSVHLLADGLTWDGVLKDAFGSGVNRLRSINGEIFVLQDGNRLYPILRPDFQVDAIMASEVSLGVGDTFPATLRFQQPGLSGCQSGASVRLRGIISRDDFIGNSDDVRWMS